MNNRIDNSNNDSKKIVIKNLSKYFSKEKYSDKEITKVIIELFTK